MEDIENNIWYPKITYYLKNATRGHYFEKKLCLKSQYMNSK
ncbi:15637_t:CDS:2 [Gigaspora margarita]|uniref:15637_t:CDS:1 n=1 Tax=Gigaspora margarita TaxID=4874 RepID=A0ABM8W5R5_GIGMA|nr:15637_t:CDS:2 [Gigaspora margarita]